MRILKIAVKIALITEGFFYFSCSNVHTKNDLTIENLKGNVKTIKEKGFDGIEKFGELQKQDMFQQTIKQFNEKGNFIKKETVGSERVVYNYNRKDMIIEKIFFRSNGKLAEKDTFMLAEKETYTYDKIGNLIEENHYNSDGSLRIKLICKYDEKGNKIEGNYYKSDGSLESKMTYKYDENGNRVEENNYNSDGTKMNIFDGPGWYSIRTFTYTILGNMIEEIHYTSDRTLNTKLTFKYDEKGNMVEKCMFGEKEKLMWKVITTYANYDKVGNWLKSAESIHDYQEWPTGFGLKYDGTIFEREIEYY